MGAHEGDRRSSSVEVEVAVCSSSTVRSGNAALLEVAVGTSLTLILSLLWARGIKFNLSSCFEQRETRTKIRARNAISS